MPATPPTAPAPWPSNRPPSPARPCWARRSGTTAEETGHEQRLHPILGRCRSEEHTSELQSPCNLVCRLLLEKKKKKTTSNITIKTSIVIVSITQIMCCSVTDP